MDSKKKVTISWSGGKDSAFALYKILACGEYDVEHLHTVIDKDTRRVGLHGIHESLIEKQATLLGLPLVKLYLPASNDHEQYASLMKSFYSVCAQDGIEAVVFGDIFLEDLKLYREALLQPTKLGSIFPLWKIDSHVLVHDFIGANFKTTICAADASLFSSEIVGREIDLDFINNLSPAIDPCGERGEFHTFVHSGPIFKKQILLSKGNVIEKKYVFSKVSGDGTLVRSESSFWFQDLLLPTIST